jgi:hypothetical protein
MVDVNISNKGYRSGKQPKHGPWGGKQADLLSSPEAAAVFPPTKETAARPKEITSESDSGVKQ